jgi:hypothetical protein
LGKAAGFRIMNDGHGEGGDWDGALEVTGYIAWRKRVRAAVLFISAPL